MIDGVPSDEIPTDLTLESLLPSGLNLDDKQLLAFYRQAFGTLIVRQNVIAKVTVALRQKEHDRAHNQTLYLRVGTAVGGVVVVALGSFFSYLFGLLHK